jgi:hypothetical protein
MNEHEFPAHGEPAERHVGSFLVRIWREPSREEGGLGPVRCFVRDLRTGREEHVGDPAELLDRLVAAIDDPVPGEPGAVARTPGSSVKPPVKAAH